MTSSAQRYKDNLLALCELNRDIIVDINNKGIKTSLHPTMISIGMSILEQSDAENIIKGFIHRSHEYSLAMPNENNNNDNKLYHPIIWERIRNKDENFLLNNSDSIFGEMSKENIAYFKEIFTLKDHNGNLAIVNKQKEQMWSIIHGMVKICIKYIHEKREPNVETKKYTLPFYDTISISKLTKKWELNSL
jgi:hypothetical protein